LQDGPKYARNGCAIRTVKVPQRQESKHQIYDCDDGKNHGGDGHHDDVHWDEECDKATEEEEKGCVEKERNNPNNRVHLESLQPVIKVREDACADKRGGTHVCLVEKFASPLLNECRDERAGETETQADEPVGIAYERCPGRSE
jgi:hypothetical protein